MQQKTALPINTPITENPYIKSEYDNSEVSSLTTGANAQKLDCKNDVADIISKPRAVYGLVGVQRYVL